MFSRHTVLLREGISNVDISGVIQHEIPCSGATVVHWPRSRVTAQMYPQYLLRRYLSEILVRNSASFLSVCKARTQLSDE
jgi:hypothetical protein